MRTNWPNSEEDRCSICCLCKEGFHVVSVTATETGTEEMFVVLCVHCTNCVNLQAQCVLHIGQAFRCSPENAFCVFNQEIHFVI